MNRLKNIRRMFGATSERIFNEAKLPNIEKYTRNRTFGRIASIKSVIKTPITTGMKTYLPPEFDSLKASDLGNYRLQSYMRVIFSRVKEDYLAMVQ